MDDIPVCERCGVPQFVGNELSWSNNGVILLGGSPVNRWVFYESDNIDALFCGLERLIGVPLNDIIVESRRRETRKYLERVYPSEIRDVLKQEQFSGTRGEAGKHEELKAIFEMAKSITTSVHNVARIYGYGDLGLGDSWERGDAYPWRETRVKKPYSLPMNMAESLGSCEAFEGVDLRVDYKEIAPETFIFTSSEGEHPIHLRGRLKQNLYQFKPGEITYDCCRSCGVPEDIARCVWNLEEGTIFDPVIERRMAVFGPYTIESLLKDLESELGDAVPRLVIEAQREHVRGALSGENWRLKASHYNNMIALRGLGNLVEFNVDENALTLLIQNACMHLLMVGTVRALVEMGMGWENSDYEYSMEEDGDLFVRISCRERI
ncbi:MAG: hypothetical protein JXA49_01880 [Actinobacteria bacterium]|nr:hypothetical protein [Actinomycetota bacterium]